VVLFPLRLLFHRSQGFRVRLLLCLDLLRRLLGLLLEGLLLLSYLFLVGFLRGFLAGCQFGSRWFRCFRRLLDLLNLRLFRRLEFDGFRGLSVDGCAANNYQNHARQ
jgi:hypothetical protein